MAVKKENEISVKEFNTYKKLAEKLQLKLDKSESKILELNEKYNKVIDVQVKKIEEKYKKVEEKYKKTIQTLEAKLERSDNSKVNNAEVVKLQKLVSKLENKIFTLESKKSALEIEKKEIELKNKELEKKLSDSIDNSDNNINRDKEIKELESRLNSLEKEKAKLEKTNEKLENKNLELNNKIKDAKTTAGKDKELTQEIKDLKSKLSSLEKEKSKLEQRNQKLSEEIENNTSSSISKDKELSQEIKDLKYKLSSLEKEKSKLEQKNQKLSEEIESNTNKSSEVKELLKEIKDLKSKLSSSESEREKLTQKLKKAIDELKTQKSSSSESSKAQRESKKENLELLKRIQKEQKLLDRKKAKLKLEEEKLLEIRKNIKNSASDIASTIRNSQINYYEKPSDKEPTTAVDSNFPTDNLTISDAPTGGSSNFFPKEFDEATEASLSKIATIMATAMDDYREQKGSGSRDTEVKKVISEGEDRLNKASDILENAVENKISTDDFNDKRPFTIIDKIENSRVEINESVSPQGQTIVAPPIDEATGKTEVPLSNVSAQSPNITVKVEAPKESTKLAKPETQLKPASETPTMRMKLLDDIDDYEKKLVITYGFDNMPENTYFSKYKKILRNATRISLLGNLQEGLDMFKLIRDQNIPEEYKQMIDKNIQDITYYLRGLHRVRIE